MSFDHLTAAYDTVWHQGLRLKRLRTVPDKHLIAFIMETLSNRRFVLRIGDIYISDIPTTLSIKLAYADDLALAFTGQTSRTP